MVGRPTTSDLVPAPLSQAANNPPYPISPTRDRKNEGNAEDDEDTGSDWDKDSDDEEPNPTAPELSANRAIQSGIPSQPNHQKPLPDALRIGSTSNSQSVTSVLPASQEVLPETLRVGSKSPSHSPQPSISNEQSSPQISTQSTGGSGRKFSINNPYLRKQSTGPSNEAITSTTSPWESPALPSHPPPPPPVTVQPASPPTDALGNISLSDQQNANSSKLLIDGFPEMRETPVEQPSSIRATQSQQEHTGFSPIAESNPWASELTAEQKWSDGPVHASGSAPVHPSEQHPTEEQVPELPPRRNPNDDLPQSQEDEAPTKPPRPGIDIAKVTASSRQEVETPMTKANRERSEHYSIKHINWFDERSSSNPRRSPIIIQNANGPCPLLALVNALVLGTPPGVETALVETLRVREQVSLGLLLDAVFEELMSGRRGGAAFELPDVGDLYAFLITLHTGMNVNPRFVSNPFDELSEKDSVAGPGAFEETREMRLYSTFAIPLLHGWLPPASSLEFVALRRSAPTYEDAQNIQFREEELEEKLRVSALTSEEQQVFEDVISIKEFLETWPTQLTDYGLQVINDSVRPGEMAILFRNDHFSTLYKEPRSNRLMTLVTDAGYSSHDEIVWESLADVSGRHSELFSGDFRPVGNVQDNAGPSSARGSSTKPQQQPLRSLLDDDVGWETVPSRRGKSSSSTSNAAGIASAQETGVIASKGASNAETSSAAASTEQEDHDLALALQLQEEEEDAHRRSQAARRREDDLSRRYLSRESPTLPIPGQDSRPQVPPRRSGRGGSNNVAATHRPNAEGEDAPPPYEQAASDRPYIPGQTPGPDGTNRQRRQSAYGQQATTNSMGQTSSPLAPGQGYPGRMTPNSPRRRGPSQTLVDQIPLGSGNGGRPMGRGGGRRSSGQQIPVSSDDRDKCSIM
ncbi:hypothetical protein EV356DRAFT_576950 [Viridothelium virens]|uniref:MINDY deubiquitinase domain-containing protein n=1 Tax=Viridothelium virens TaxID=1048519 RepID=A0A6A6H835_VIRVR|nr:hypothetical protein EV356DRAFT_576950 [Viridothelium virens]